MPKRSRPRAPLALLLGLTSALAACRSPTQITLEFSTDARCVDVHGLIVTVGVLGEIETRAPIASTLRCRDDGYIGSVVVVPSGGRSDEIAVRAAMGFGAGADAAGCEGAGAKSGCIVARRDLHFVPHTPLTLPVTMYAACAGVACSASQTCAASGACVSAQIDPMLCSTPGGCDKPLPPPARCGDGRKDPGEVCDGADTGGATCAGLQGPLATGKLGCSADCGSLLSSGCDPCGALDAAQGGAWPMRSRCPSHAGRTPVKGPQTPHVKWQRSFPGATGLVGSPVVDRRGTVYVPGDHTLYALGPDGASLWAVDMPDLGPALDSPAIGPDGTVYLTSGIFNAAGGVLSGFTPAGAPRCHAALAAGGAGSLMIDPDGHVHFGQAGSLYAFDPACTPLWAAPISLPGVQFSYPALGPSGALYIASSTDVLLAFGPDGAPAWHDDFGPGPDMSVLDGAPATAPDGTVYMLGNDGAVHALGPDGARRWSLPLTTDLARDVEHGFGTSCAIADDGTIYAAVRGGFLAAVSPAGVLRWTSNLTNRVNSSSPIVGGDGTIYLGDMTGQVHAIRPDGTPLWTATLDGDIDATLAIGPDGTLFAATIVGSLYAIGP